MQKVRLVRANHNKNLATIFFEVLKTLHTTNML